MIILTFLYFLRCTDLEKTVITDGNIYKGMTMLDNLKSQTDFFISYIIKKYFLNKDNKEEDALFDLIMSEKYLGLVYVFHVLSTNTMYDTPKDVCKFLLKIGKKCHTKYLENGYNFTPKINYKDKVENYRNFLILVKGRDKNSLKVFFELLASKKLPLKDHIPLLEYLASKNVPKSFGYLGEAYYYGEGVEKSIDKALTYYLKGKEFGRDYISYNGIGKILMSSEYEDYSGAKEHFDMISDLNFNEAEYRQYVLFNDHFKIETYAQYFLSKSVSLGFLPAIFVDGQTYYKKGDYKSALTRLEALIEYDEIVLDLQSKAYIKYKNKEYLSCLILLLMTVEMGSTSSLENAIFLLENHKIVKSTEKQSTIDGILFYLYKKHENSSLKYVNRIGDCYFYGKGVDQSYKTAFAYYLTSGSIKNTEGLVSLFFVYTKGLGTEKNMKKAYRCLRSIILDDNNYLLVGYLYLLLVIMYLVNWYTIVTVFTCFISYNIYNKLIIRKYLFNK